MEQNSGVKFQQAMVALARQWVGADSSTAQPENVTIVLPDETQGSTVGVEGTKNALKTETYPLPATVEEARDMIERWQEAARGIRDDENVSDNVVQHMLHDRTSLLDERWAGTEDEERAAYVSELLYIHSKVMIVDDRRVIVSPGLAGEYGRVLTIMRRWVRPTSTIVVRRSVSAPHSSHAGC